MLDPFSRGAVVALTTLCFASLIALTPIRARSFVAENERQPAPPGPRAPLDTLAIVPVARDPFDEPVGHDAMVPATSVSRSPLRRAMGALPSNLRSDTIPGMPGSVSDSGAPSEPASAGSAATMSRVTAIVTGAHPYAMIETNGDHEIKGIGDRVGGVAIVAIGLDGLRLQNGQRLTVERAARQ